jgi:hypothetical protein
MTILDPSLAVSGRRTRPSPYVSAVTSQAKGLAARRSGFFGVCSAERATPVVLNDPNAQTSRSR